MELTKLKKEAKKHGLVVQRKPGREKLKGTPLERSEKLYRPLKTDIKFLEKHKYFGYKNATNFANKAFEMLLEIERKKHNA